MPQDETERQNAILSDFEGLSRTLVGLQRRLSKAPSPETALLRDAVREALQVTARARLLSGTDTGTAALRR